MKRGETSETDGRDNRNTVGATERRENGSEKDRIGGQAERTNSGDENGNGNTTNTKHPQNRKQYGQNSDGCRLVWTRIIRD